MQHAHIEHVNISVIDAEITSKKLCRIFGWDIRWSGKDNIGQDAYHIGPEGSYIAICTAPSGRALHHQTPTLNHIGIVVGDLDATESRIRAAGYETHSHGDYEPGRRFYYHDKDGIEYEIVSYAKTDEAFKAAFFKQLSKLAKSACMYK